MSDARHVHLAASPKAEPVHPRPHAKRKHQKAVVRKTPKRQKRQETTSSARRSQLGSGPAAASELKGAGSSETQESCDTMVEGGSVPAQDFGATIASYRNDVKELRDELTGVKQALKAANEAGDQETVTSLQTTATQLSGQIQKLIDIQSKLVDTQRDLVKIRLEHVSKPLFAAAIVADHVWSVLPAMQKLKLKVEELEVYTLPEGAAIHLESTESSEYGRSDCLVVRRSGRQFGKLVRAGMKRLRRGGKKVERFILSGNPGTGKSVWHNYMLKLCSARGYTVMEQQLKAKLSTVTVLRPGCPARRYTNVSATYVYSNLVSEGIPASKIVYLCDTGDKCTDDPDRLPCATVLTSSPDKDHFSGFQKARAQLWYWPTWSWEELAAARRYLFTPAMTEEKLRKRYDVVGGVIRHLALDDIDFATLVDGIRRAIAGLPAGAILDNVRQSISTHNDSEVGELSHKIFQVVPCEQTIRDGVIVQVKPSQLNGIARLLPISDTCHRWILDQLPKVQLTDAYAWWHHMMVWRGLRSGVELGHEFEKLFFFLSRGRTLPPLTRVAAAQGSKVPMTFESHQLKSPYVVAACEAMSGSYKDNVLYQAAKTTGAIDGWLCEWVGGRRVLWLLQLTVGGSHEVKMGPLAFAMKALRRQGAWSDAEVRLAFVVPWWQASKYVEGAQSVKPPKEAPSGDRRYYAPASMKWQNALPTTLRDKNGLEADPFTLAEAKRATSRLCQWVWVCGSDLRVLPSDAGSGLSTEAGQQA